MGKQLLREKDIIIPSTVYDIVFNTETHSIVIDGALHGVLEKGIYEKYVQVLLKKHEGTKWFADVINYFHPQLITFFFKEKWYTASVRTLLKQYRTYPNFPKTVWFFPIEYMEVTSDSPHLP
jgi:hypothetical protein